MDFVDALNLSLIKLKLVCVFVDKLKYIAFFYNKKTIAKKKNASE